VNEDEEERLEEIISQYNQDIQMPPYDSASTKRNETREYREYKEEERADQALNRYEKLCNKSAEIIPISADKPTKDKLSNPLKLMGWKVTPGMVISASIIVGLSGFMAWTTLFTLNFVLGNPVPISMMAVFGIVPFVAAGYTYLKPVYAAKEKVVRSSQDMILSILYMVIYMRTSPNLEGAVRFAALNLDGPISNDFKRVLWNVEIGNFSRVEDSLEKYSRNWKDYNDDFLQSLELIESAVKEPSPSRRESLLDDSIERILDGTEEKMNSYAKGLKTPVAILNAFGALLPILGMIMLPLISAFIDAIGAIHVIILFNVILPASLYMFTKQILTSRPPTISTSAMKEHNLPEVGYYKTTLMGKELKIKSSYIGGGVLLLLATISVSTFAAFPYLLPVTAENAPSVPIFYSNGSGNQLTMLMRGVVMVAAIGLGLGTKNILGTSARREAQENLRKIEKQFPSALFQLSNELSGGTPIEIALKNAAKESSELEISGLFRKSSQNIEQLGMTFKQSLFDDSYGAVQKYPTKTVSTVMKVLAVSSSKGTSMVAQASGTVSRYMDRLKSTQNKLEDLLEDSTTTIKLLSYMLAPIISGVAVGMSQTIITAISSLTQRFASLETGGAAPIALPFSSTSAISPEIIQMVVGIYLIQLLYVLGGFYTKITRGNDPVFKRYFRGKILIVGVTIYVAALLIITSIFTTVIGGVTTAI
jgi:Flp pilus assembly protein TadB